MAWVVTAFLVAIAVTLAVLFATTVSFLIASVILKASKAPAEDDLDQATHRMEALKGKKSSVSAALIGEGVGASGVAVLATPIKNIVFACDAGMGSSAMGASVLRNKIKAAGFPDVADRLGAEHRPGADQRIIAEAAGQPLYALQRIG